MRYSTTWLAGRILRSFLVTTIGIFGILVGISQVLQLVGISQKLGISPPIGVFVALAVIAGCAMAFNTFETHQ